MCQHWLMRVNGPTEWLSGSGKLARYHFGYRAISGKTRLRAGGADAVRWRGCWLAGTVNSFGESQLNVLTLVLISLARQCLLLILGERL
jgi:hypothetical protein